MLDLPLGMTTQTASVRKPTFAIHIGDGDMGGTGGLLEAAGSALGLAGGSDDPWAAALVSITVDMNLAPGVNVAILQIANGAPLPMWRWGTRARLSWVTPTAKMSRSSRARWRPCAAHWRAPARDTGRWRRHAGPPSAEQELSAADGRRHREGPAGRTGVTAGTVKDRIDLTRFMSRMLRTHSTNTLPAWPRAAAITPM